MSLAARSLAETIVDDAGRIKPSFADLEHELRAGWLERVGAGEVLSEDEDG